MSFTLRRRAARVVLLDDDGRVLLLEAHDPARPHGGTWWEIPGGGIDPHESSADAARRELREEAGVHEADIGPCVWVQRARFSFGGWRFDQWEEIHVAWCTDPPATWQPAGLEALEAVAFQQHRWWELDELLTSDARVLPARLRHHLPDLVAGRMPAEPIDITAEGFG